MLIVLEGMDGVGKSTLAKMLADLLGTTTIKSTASTPNTFDYFRRIIEESRHKNIVADRFCYDQFVYQNEKARWLRGDDLIALELLMMGSNTKIIHVKADPKEILDRLTARTYEKNVYTLQDIQKLCNKFDDVMKGSILPIYTYWTTKEEM